MTNWNYISKCKNFRFWCNRKNLFFIDSCNQMQYSILVSIHTKQVSALSIKSGCSRALTISCAPRPAPCSGPAGKGGQGSLGHRVLVQMEGTAHIDFPKIETAEAINFKILPVMHMQKLWLLTKFGGHSSKNVPATPLGSFIFPRAWQAYFSSQDLQI